MAKLGHHPAQGMLQGASLGLSKAIQLLQHALERATCHFSMAGVSKIDAYNLMVFMG